MLQLTIAVMSDLHVYDAAIAGESPSWLSTFAPQGNEDQHPIAALKALIARESLTAEILLCPGDLGDQARPSAVQYAWQCVHEIAHNLKADVIAGSTGNHDCDSRYKHNDFDAKGLLQDLSPPYPLADELANNRYWARNFALIEGSNYRLLVLNSSAYHGNSKDDGVPEYEHGRISTRTISWIKDALSNSPPKPVNILLCHHHPYPHAELGLGEDDLMVGGQELLELIGSGAYGSWLVVHGHKHHPKLSYAGGLSTAAVVFASASLAAVLKGVIASVVRNQFHLISIPLDKIDTLGLVGTIRSWDWVTGLGWRIPSGQSQLPAIAGFGCRTPPQLLVARITKIVKNDRIPWDTLRQKVPEVDFVLPGDFNTMRRTLENSGISILESDGKLIEIARLT